MVPWHLYDPVAFLLVLSLLLPSLLIMFIPSTFKRPVSSWKALNLRKTLLMASSVRLKPLNCSRLPCVYAQETLTFLLTQKKTCVKNYVPYYPSECHADYFDFERIEALKPAIEACGISTLSQSPMLGFHKQMDNRIKLLEEILSFRMQGVEFDNGDMYVDGHKAASDVRD